VIVFSGKIYKYELFPITGFNYTIKGTQSLLLIFRLLLITYKGVIAEKLLTRGGLLKKS